MPDLAEPDFSSAVPCQSPVGGFCVWGSIEDLGSLMPRGGHVALAAGFATLAESDGPNFALQASSVPAVASLIVTGPDLTTSQLTFQPAANDVFRIDPFGVPSTLGAEGGALELFFSDFSPSPIKQTLAAFSPVSGVAVSASGVDGGTGAVRYLSADRGALAAGSSTTAAGVAWVPQGASVSASGGSCAGPCVWPDQSVPSVDASFVLLVPRYQ
jgi:hypothetical protein